MKKIIGITVGSILLTSAVVFSKPIGGTTIFYGQKISKADESSIYGKVGLKNGDIIILADDKPMDSPSDAMSLYNNLTSKMHVKLLISRGGHFETLLIKK